jgi:4-hydroxy-tetrahydrodipicolinate synthase
MNSLKGTGVALVTPFKSDKSIDFNALKKLVDYVIKGKSDYLVVLGTTGETATLSAAEQVEVLETVKQINEERLPIVLGMGGNDSMGLVQKMSATRMDGVTALLSASPYYNKPSQEGIYQHYRALAENTDKQIILYNVPGRTASNISAETTLRLAHDFKNIVGIKEASADLDQVMNIINGRPESFLVISGEDGLTFPIITCGGDGVISVVANAFPAEFSQMVRFAAAADLVKARELHYRLKGIIDLLFVEGNPGGVKAALAELGLCEEHLRLPLWPVSEALKLRLKQAIEEIKRN